MAKKLKRTKKYEIIGKRYNIFHKKNQAGVHLLIDFWFGKNIENEERLRRILLKAGKESKSIPLTISVYKFNPQGITGVILLAESHIAIHSWPEINYLGIDIFTCGNKTQPRRAFEYLKREFQPQKIKIKTIERGVVKKTRQKK